MKRASYYARVSTLAQKEQGTIRGQQDVLTAQIRADGNILVKKYVDEGWSGSNLERPALDRLRNDLKKNLFDVVYFIDSDRISRDVGFQRIIISELLKYEKGIIVKGKNYVNDPENKLTMTVLGAVNEFERTKIMERTIRGRRSKARRGSHVDGARIFGYTYVKKTDKTDGHRIINDEEADIIRFMFEAYARTEISLNGLCRLLEKKRIKTASGKDYWKSSVVRGMLTNENYIGNHYFNRVYKVEPRKKRTNKRYARSRKTGVRVRDSQEWIKIPMPAIIDKSLFNDVQRKLSRNKKVFRGDTSYLLSGLIKCGECGHTYSGTQWKGVKYYKCNYRDKRYNHVKDTALPHCRNSAVNGDLIERMIENAVETRVLDPQIIRGHIDVLKSKKDTTVKRLNGKAAGIKNNIKTLEGRKGRIIDLYADGHLDKNDYIAKMQELKIRMNALVQDLEETDRQIMLIGNTKLAETDVNNFCRLSKKKWEMLNGADKFLFLKKIVEEIVITKNNAEKSITIRGLIPPHDNLLPAHCNSSGRGTNNAQVMKFEITTKLPELATK